MRLHHLLPQARMVLLLAAFASMAAPSLARDDDPERRDAVRRAVEAGDATSRLGLTFGFCRSDFALTSRFAARLFVLFALFATFVRVFVFSPVARLVRLAITPSLRSSAHAGRGYVEYWLRRK